MKFYKMGVATCIMRIVLMNEKNAQKSICCKNEYLSAIQYSSDALN